MSNRKEIVTAAGSLAIAIGIGYVMQSSEAAQKMYGTEGAASAPAVASSFLPTSQSGLALGLEATLASATTFSEDYSTPLLAGFEPLAEGHTLRPRARPSISKADCEVTATAQPTIGAMIHVKVLAPCLDGQNLTLHHSGMAFTETTDARGQLSMLVPALARHAVIVVEFENGDGTVLDADADDFPSYARTVLQWRGDTGLSLRALEFNGTDPVWSGAAQNLTGVTNGKNGLMVRLGSVNADAAWTADVYTFPVESSVKYGKIDLSIQAEVTQANCANDISGETLEIGHGGTILSRDVSLTMPSCDDVGEILVLNNLVSDLKVARN